MERFRPNELSVKEVIFNPNTVLLSKTNGVSTENFKWILPEKISNRIGINNNGLNRLATTIIAPDYIPEINYQTLKIILDFSNQVNIPIGLPETDSLIIRTSSPKNGKNRSVSYEQPALLVKGLFSNQVTSELLETSTTPKTTMTLDEFVSQLPKETYLLIHDDNYKLQLDSLHGRMGPTSNGWELLCGTKMLHPRPLERYKKAKQPIIRITQDNIDDFMHINPRTVSLMVQHNRVNSTNGFSFEHFNCDTGSDVLNLFQRIQHEGDLIAQVFQDIHKLYDKQAVMEFRVYNYVEGAIGNRLHILDVNSKF